MLIGALSGGTLTQTPTGAVNAIETTPATPVDVVDVRPADGKTLWREARQAGLVAAAAATPGPIGELLSAEARKELVEVLHQLELNGLRFSVARLPGLLWKDRHTPLSPQQVAARIVDGDTARLDVDGRGMHHVPLRSLDDVHTLHAFHGDGDLGQLARPQLAAALEFMERSQEVFGRTSWLDRSAFYHPHRDFDPGRYEASRHSYFLDCSGSEIDRIGTYGAYKELLSSKGLEEPILSGYAPFPSTGAGYADTLVIESEQQLCETLLGFWHEDGHLERAPLARSLRDLEAQGYSFHHDGETVTSWKAWKELRAADRVTLGVGGAPLEDVTAADLEAGRISPEARAWHAHHEDVIKPLKQTIGTWDTRCTLQDDVTLLSEAGKPGVDDIRMLGELHRALVPKEGIQASRETYRFVQSQQQDRPEALRKLLESYVMTGSLQVARKTLTWTQAEERISKAVGTVQRAAETVSIGGLKVPIRLT